MEQETLEQTCRRLEHYETPRWAADAILRCEIITPWVVDPCCGTGVLSDAALAAGAQAVTAIDIHDWGYRGGHSQEWGGDAIFHEQDWLKWDHRLEGATVFVNPPFKRAVEFIEHALSLDARKVICFQRFAWWESQKRGPFWMKHPPNRVYVCGDRADCWRHDIPEEDRGSGSTTAHAWYVWERGQPSGTLLGHIRRTDAIT